MLSSKAVASQFKVLSCETRVDIIKLLKRGPMKVTEIAEALSVSQPAISQHLKLLKAAGLVADKKDGYWVSYSLNPVQLLAVRRELEEVCRCRSVDCAKTLRVYKQELLKEVAWIDQQLEDIEGPVLV